jgi:transcriptional antiterminator NusG
MIKMIMTDESWYVVRNTRGVTGFVGPASKPVPISDEEVAKLRIEKAAPIDFEIGDHVSINSGQMEGFTGTIESIDAQSRKVSVRAVTFNREMLVELDVGQISHID